MWFPQQSLSKPLHLDFQVEAIGPGYAFIDTVHSKAEFLFMCTYYVNSAPSMLLLILKVIYWTGTEMVTLQKIVL